ncbi:Maf-like protein [Clostridium niameyense]|uniref:dTTP/UTP pyrophosphatase n=1 Tax=Clostridium niameyense TaxID=1622073 RepID=A0A6M0R7R2_9CLOT|nr:Maf-like protein [Clostridium niameyense]NEZ45659.1 Maf-like protein [Clostridium niameyense]
MKQIILASASKRRQELLKLISNNFHTIVSNFDESSIIFSGDVTSYVTELAEGKALNVLENLQDKKDKVIIGCDTLVYYNDTILGKPRDEEEAYYMLKRLSGSVHEVYSGLAIIDSDSKTIKKDYVCTKVKFDTLKDEEIYKYVKTGDPMDKAGAYGIQGKASIFVENISGCYYNVVGLPLNKLYKMLQEVGVNL